MLLDFLRELYYDAQIHGHEIYSTILLHNFQAVSCKGNTITMQLIHTI